MRPIEQNNRPVHAQVYTVSKSSSAAGHTERRPVKARVTLAFQLNFKVIIS